MWIIYELDITNMTSPSCQRDTLCLARIHQTERTIQVSSHDPAHLIVPVDDLLLAVCPHSVHLFVVGTVVVSPGLLVNTKPATLVLCRGAGAGHQDPYEEARADISQEQVAATPSRPEPSQQRPHENTPRGRMVRNTRQRMQDKRQKHLRGSFQKRSDKNSSEPAEPVPDNRGTLPVTEDRLLSEAARTLDNICSDYLCSLERMKVTN